MYGMKMSAANTIDINDNHIKYFASLFIFILLKSTWPRGITKGAKNPLTD